MVPFQVTERSGKLNITWESLFWFAVVTAVGTVIGTYVYNQYVQPYLTLRASTTCKTLTCVIPTTPKLVNGNSTFLGGSKTNAKTNLSA